MQIVSRNGFLHLLLLVLLSFPAGARCATLKVACGQKAPFATIGSAMKALSSFSPQGPNAVVISGACHENVVIERIDRLTLIAAPGASLDDASGGVDPVVDVRESSVTFRGFTINGGVYGVLCRVFSTCRFDDNTIQGALVAGIQAGESRLTFNTNILQNNGIGMALLESTAAHSNGGLVIRNNLGAGVDLDTGASLVAVDTTIRDNGANGIEANSGCYLLMVRTTVTGNAWQGVFVTANSTADLEQDNVITGNGGSGLWVKDGGFAEFRGTNTITGNNSGLDVACTPQFPATRGALANIGGGVTNCVEP